MPNPIVKQIAVKNGSEYTTADIGTSADKITYGVSSNVAAKLDSLTTDLNEKSTVTVTPATVSGTLVGTINVNGSNNQLYAPTPTTVVANRDGASASILLTELTVGSDDWRLPPEVEANLTLQGEEALLTSLKVGDTSYKNVSVSANPQDTTATLTGIAINGINYAVASGSVSNLNDIGDVTISTPSNGQMLKYNGTGWVNDNIPNASLDSLSNTTITSPSNDQVLKYNNGYWVNANESGGSGSVVHLADIGDVVITSAVAGQGLRYNGTNWVNDTITTTQSLNDLSNVSLTSPSEGQVLKYDSDSGEWVNADESGGGAIGRGQWVDLTGTLTAGSTILTISNSIIDVDSTFDIYTSVFGVNPTNVVAFTQGITLYFDAQPNDIGVKVRVTSDYMPGGNGNVSGSIPVNVIVTEVTE